MALWKHLFGGILLAGLPVSARAESYLCQVQYFQKGKSKPPVVAAMPVYFKKNEAGDFEQMSLAGTDFGTRLYVSASSSEAEDVSVECRFRK